MSFCDQCDSKGVIHKKDCPNAVKKEENKEEPKEAVKEEVVTPRFKLNVNYNFSDVPSFEEVVVFCIAAEGLEISLDTYQQIPKALQGIFKQI